MAPARVRVAVSLAAMVHGITLPSFGRRRWNPPTSPPGASWGAIHAMACNLPDAAPGALTRFENEDSLFFRETVPTG
jgi:hypothetical protein